MERATTARRGDLPLLLVVVLGLVVIPALLVLAPGGWPSIVLPFWAALTALHVGYALLTRRLAAIYTDDGDPLSRGARRLWSLAWKAGTLLVVGDLSQVALSLHAPHSRDAATGCGLQVATVVVGMSMVLYGLLRFPSQGGSREGRMRLRLDAATVMAGAATAGFLLINLPSGAFGWQWVIKFVAALLLQPGLFLVVLFALVKLFLGERAPFTRGAAVVTGLSAAMQVVMQGVPETGHLSTHTGAWLMAGNVVCSALLVIGTRLQWRGARLSDRGFGRRQTRSYSWLPYGAMGVAWLLAIGAAVVDPHGNTWRSWAADGGAGLTTVLVVARQITAFRHVEELLRERDVLTARLTEQAYHDVLTGLGNRALFMAALSSALDRGPVTVFLIDLDEFKPVNDSFGHATGDQLLIEVAGRLRRCVRDGDTVARLGGDEFAIIAEDLDQEAAAELSARLGEALSGTVRLGEAEVTLRASVGLATGVPETHTSDSLLHQADMAMYARKGARAYLTDHEGLRRGPAAAWPHAANTRIQPRYSGARVAHPDNT